MKNLTKQEILKIVKESNEEALEEYFPSDANNVRRARQETLERYQGLISGAKNFLDQFVQKAKGDFENNIISDADVEYLINDQCERLEQAVQYVVASLQALKEQGIKPSEFGPVHPTSRYEE